MNDATPPFRWFRGLNGIANRRELGLYAFLVVFVLAVAACASEPASDGGDAMPPGSSTADLATPAAGAYELARILPDVKIEAMTGAYPVPGAVDEMIVLTKMGQLWRVSLRPEVAPTLFGDISERLSAELGYEQGLLGLAFSPAFESDGQVYLFYSTGSPDRSVLARYTVANGTLNVASETVILEVPQPAPKHNGGQIAFGPDGYLYVALGDGGLPEDAAGNAQNLGTLLGSLLRIEPAMDGYDVPPDNPFVDLPGARPEIYAYGFRNPWRFSFDRATGEIWLGDVGEARWEEVDRVTAGGNYGWGIF
ncbi:MAG: PQQ-dependent sugar dehydrogenase, partial [Chloroflexi bacterium]|nr:PQQ-dependent sugar dehydrogenase [Chloroflexota bacterium]